ncbi:protein involved in gliding motility GldK [Tenacibaculum skagerrakense]|uniref:Protein involved in gliding motility GldK n=1 Tax=Tenacibaculum skagerrakense TaxID=186571 RepID=A0A4R2P2Y3_9FLAO|nr:gliding motility lipoprotein GldK [Tenacibaculum skagerrakense]TCP28498.1 protein involved in gliding motility GldK [Tenacibaculum skagerrakense]
MKKVALFALILVFFYSCGSSNDRGELVGVKSKRKWFAEKPFGMVYIKGGSFTMGKQDEDPLGAMNAPTRTVTVQPFYMDETEITNSEYKQFVYWVRDSIVRTKLAYQAEFASVDPVDGAKPTGIQLYAFASKDTVGESPYEKYMRENYYEVGQGLDSIKPLNWEEEIIWNKEDFPDADYVEVMDSLFLNKDEALNGIPTFNTKLLNYRYYWFDNEEAARTGGNRKAFLRDKVLNVYPDTTVWIKDFNYSYNDPMHQEYFAHKAFEDYPVVGVDWFQARAFCHWRTKNKNAYQRSKKNLGLVPSFRLPTEAEWEYAARGGLDYAKYPWGGPSTTSDRGCFLANFKPVRGDYAADGALYTVEAMSYNPNGFGLYNMAGNVSEWTHTAYNQMSYYMGSTMNPNVENIKNRRKIVRGGSWKDVAYFLEVGSRDWEYADTSRSYIGFRTVQDYLGTKKQ